MEQHRVVHTQYASSIEASTSRKSYSGRKRRLRQHHGHFSNESVCVRAQGGESSRGPFGRNVGKKEEEAKRALEGLFHGKRDLLAAYDPDSGSGGAGRGGGKKGTGGSGPGGSESGGSSWQSPDWKQWTTQLLKRFGRIFRTLSAILGFIGIILLIPMVPQLFGAILTFLKLLLRLDGRARRLPSQPAVDPYILAGTQNLGLNEISVMSKYGNDGS